MRAGIAILLALVVALTGCTLITGELTPTPAIPSVMFAFPANNVSVTEGTDLQIEIIARDEGIGISRVALRVDGVVIREAQPVEADAVPVFVVDMNWLAEGSGAHVLEAIAYRPDGTSSDPALIRVQVSENG